MMQRNAIDVVGDIKQLISYFLLSMHVWQLLHKDCRPVFTSHNTDHWTNTWSSCRSFISDLPSQFLPWKVSAAASSAASQWLPRNQSVLDTNTIRASPVSSSCCHNSRCCLNCTVYIQHSTFLQSTTNDMKNIFKIGQDLTKFSHAKVAGDFSSTVSVENMLGGGAHQNFFGWHFAPALCPPLANVTSENTDSVSEGYIGLG